MRLKDKICIVTGAGTGIGRATAILFAREGAKVAVAYLEEDDDARFVADRVADEGSDGLIGRGAQTGQVAANVPVVVPATHGDLNKTDSGFT